WPRSQHAVDRSKRAGSSSGGGAEESGGRRQEVTSPVSAVFSLNRLPPRSHLLSSPVRPHLRQPVHVHRDAFPLLFGRERFQELERFCKVGLYRLASGLVVQPLDFGELLIR